MSGPSAPGPTASPEPASPLDADALGELVSAHADLCGVGVAVVSLAGERLAAAGPGVDAPALGHHHIHPLYYDGARLFDIVIGPCLRRHDGGQPVSSKHGAPGALVGSSRHTVGWPFGAPSAGASSPELAAAIPELSDADLERLAHHLERVLLLVIRRGDARPHAPAPSSPAPPDLDPVALKGEVERAKSALLSTVSHEMRTPLTSVIGYAEMLLEGMAGPINDEQREYLSTILGKSDHLLRLISSMLDLARLETSAPTVERRPVALIDVIERAAASLTSEAERRAISINLVSGGRLPRVMADARRIRQVLMHLIANAIKFTPRGGEVVVTAEVGPLSPSDLLSAPVEPAPTVVPEELARRFGVRVSVHDTGIGISPMAQARIFEPFFQVDQSSTREYSGTGLGLSLAKSYVEAHGGSIWVHSQPGGGSTFTLSLPAEPEDLHDHLTRGDPDGSRT